MTLPLPQAAGEVVVLVPPRGTGGAGLHRTRVPCATDRADAFAGEGGAVFVCEHESWIHPLTGIVKYGRVSRMENGDEGMVPLQTNVPPEVADRVKIRAASTEHTISAWIRWVIVRELNDQSVA